MELAEILRRRHMVRAYRSDPVPREVVERIVGVLQRAQSAGFAQPHRIAVVTEPDRRRRLAAVAEGWYLERGHQPWLTQAPVHLVLGVREASYHERYQEPDKIKSAGEIPWPVPFWWFDSGALFMLLQLAAIDEGLAAGFYSPSGPEDLAALGRIAGLPEDAAIAGVITVGYRGDEPEGRAERLRRRRKPLDELVYWH